MSSITTATLPLAVSRPKVHRLPAGGRRKNQKKALLPGFLLFWAAVLVMLIVVSLSIKKEPVVKEATMLPAVAVVSDRMPSEPVDTKTQGTSSILSVSVGDAQAAPTPVPVYTAPANSGDTIMLKDRSSMIVGQMARIPLNNDQITEVKPINTVDNGGGRELLSIVGKY